MIELIDKQTGHTLALFSSKEVDEAFELKKEYYDKYVAERMGKNEPVLPIEEVFVLDGLTIFNLAAKEEKRNAKSN